MVQIYFYELWHEKVPKNNVVRDAIIGRHVFEAIGSDNKLMWEAAIAPQDGEIDLKTFTEEENNNTDVSVAALCGDSIYWIDL